jgi:hypothetical protein
MMIARVEDTRNSSYPVEAPAMGAGNGPGGDAA